MKVGDILICKKNFSRGVKYTTIFSKGKYYSIDKITVKPDKYLLSCYMLIGGYVFTLDNDYGNDVDKRHLKHIYVWDHFYTEKEYRKLKLDKIEEI